MVYTMDYGYLDGSRSGDGNGIDVWRGSDLGAGLVGVLCSVDIVKSDSEVKLLIDCTEGEIEAATRFMNNQYMSAIVVRRPR
jgi:inorganic pyrophosphatase